jgi:hypothetical protein
VKEKYYSVDVCKFYRKNKKKKWCNILHSMDYSFHGPADELTAWGGKKDPKSL